MRWSESRLAERRSSCARVCRSAQLDDGAPERCELIRVAISPLSYTACLEGLPVTMKLLGLSGSTVGRTTRKAMDAMMEAIRDEDPSIELQLIDLAELDLKFTDGRHISEYKDDAKTVTEAVMAADAIIIGTPIFQASIPAALKNIFDLLPDDAFHDTTVGILVTAGSAKHYLVADYQLRPILTYMKAQIAPGYVFIESKDMHHGKIVSDDVTWRIQQLAMNTVEMTKTLFEMRRKREARSFL